MLQAVRDTSDEKTMQSEKRALEAAQEELGIPGKIISIQEYLYQNLIKE